MGVKSSPTGWRLTWLVVGAAVGIFAFGSHADTNVPASPIAEKVDARVNEAKQELRQSGEEARSKMEVLWQRIDERRLKNRTPDELVAWVLMGLLVGGMLYRFGRGGQLFSVVLGLVGAFLGGIVAHATQLNLGLGPVLITYEDLLCSLAGGVLILGGTRWFRLLKIFKPVR